MCLLPSVVPLLVELILPSSARAAGIITTPAMCWLSAVLPDAQPTSLNVR